MRKGNWKHPRIFSDPVEMEIFASTWFREHMYEEGFNEYTVHRPEVEAMIADDECVDPVVALMKNRITPDFIELWACHKGWFLIREFE